MPRGSTHAGSDTVAVGPDDPQMIAEAEAPRRRALWQHAAFVVGGPLLVGAAAVTILVTRFQSVFLINDDTALASIANGDYTGRRSSSLVVAPAMFGHILRLGYWLVPDLPWYGITLYALQIVAWAAIGTTAFMLQRRPPIAERLVLAAVIIAVAPWTILRVSFTPTSLLLGVAGILVFAAAAKVPGRLGVVYAVVGGLLLGTAVLVRTYSFVAVVVVFAPVLAVIFVKAGLRRSAVFAVTVGALVVVGFGTNRLEYSRTGEWRAFKTMNSARGFLHDTPRLANQNVSNGDLQQIEWTRNDLWLFADFIYPDPDVYSDQDIRTLAKLSPPIRNDISPRRIFDVLRDSSDRVGDQGPAVASLAIIAALLALRRNRTAAVVTLVSVAWFVVVLIALLLYLRLPGRLLIPLEAGAAFMAASVPTYLSPAPPRTSSRMPWTSGAVVALVAVFVIGPAWHGIHSASRISSDNQRRVRASQATLDKLEAFDPKGIFVARGNRFGMAAEPLTTNLPFKNPRIVGLGWTTNSPLFTARLARIGIDDLYAALQTNHHVYLVGSSVEAARIALFYRQHRDVEVRFRHKAGPVQGIGPLAVYIWSASSGPAR